MRLPKAQKICSKCGGLLRLVLRSGFIVKGQSRYFAVNADDGTPHAKRCQLNQALLSERRSAKQQGSRRRRKLSKSDVPTTPTQKDLF